MRPAVCRALVVFCIIIVLLGSSAAACRPRNTNSCLVNILHLRALDLPRRVTSAHPESCSIEKIMDRIETMRTRIYVAAHTDIWSTLLSKSSNKYK
ncbi:hypothetical protein C2E23DRAFT_537271 [Lenzites betulinus]|nr:hypothetical protein C2E23DRAFT_537271 [Lenzites betulinus]